MAALTSAVDRVTRESGGGKFYEDYVVNDESQIYQGAIVCFESGGDEIIPAADTSGLRCAGIAAQSVLGDGTKRCRVFWGLQVKLPKAAAITGADVGAVAVAVDDDTVTDAADATNDVEVGVIRSIEGDYAWVEVLQGPVNA